jgi:hypothetical protein
MGVVMDGSCFGMTVRSPLPLRFLRDGPAGDPIEIEPAARTAVQAEPEPLLAFTATAADGSPARAALRRAEGGRFLFEVEDVGAYLIDTAGRIELPRDGDRVRAEQMLWNVPAMLVALARGCACVHAAVVEIGGRAVLLAAPGRFGKTTLALAFHVAGYRVLSEDVACIGFQPEPACLPGPALLRVRDDGAAGAVPAGLELAARRPGRCEYAIAPARRGNGTAVPLGAVVRLREADEIRLHRVAAADVVRDLFALAFRLPDPEAQAAAFAAAADVAAAVPCFDLERPLRLDQLPATVERVAAGVAA